MSPPNCPRCSAPVHTEGGVYGRSFKEPNVPWEHWMVITCTKNCGFVDVSTWPHSNRLAYGASEGTNENS